MPKVFGQRLSAPDTEVEPTECDRPDCRDHPPVPHHDHLLDRIHQQILARLRYRYRQPSGDGGARVAEAAFSLLLYRHGRRILGFVNRCTIRPELPLLRFPASPVCIHLNPRDGHGKPAAKQRGERADAVDHWSMTVEELIAADTQEAWQKIFECDAPARDERLACADAIAKRIADAWYARQARRPGSPPSAHSPG